MPMRLPEPPACSPFLKCSLSLQSRARSLQGYFYQLALTAGLQRARAAPAVAMNHLTIVWGLLSDMLLFHQRPNAIR